MRLIGVDADFNALAAFFLANTDETYISHGEVLSGRALEPGRWSPDALRLLAAEMHDWAVRHEHLDQGGVYVAKNGGGLLALALLDVLTHSPWAILEDVVIRKDARGSGLGGKILAFMESEARAGGCARIMLESGAGNTRAHEFFQRRGFAPLSVVMFKDIAC